MPRDDAPPFEYRIELRDGYVFIWQSGRAASEKGVKGMQGEIEEAMRSVGTRFVIFDNRETATPDEYVRAAMWAWLTEHVDRAAFIQNEVRNIKRAEERGELNRITVRAFHNLADAEDWLLSVR